MKHKAQLTISRPNYSDGKNKIKISVRDTEAVINFMDIEIDLDKFTECLTGLSLVDCDMEVRGLENVGKKRESMDIVFELPKEKWHVSKEEAAELAKKATPEGWVCSTYFGSQDSFFKKDDKYYGKTTANRWVVK
jgi:hypothetical protein